MFQKNQIFKNITKEEYDHINDLAFGTKDSKGKTSVIPKNMEGIFQVLDQSSAVTLNHLLYNLFRNKTTDKEYWKKKFIESSGHFTFIDTKNLPTDYDPLYPPRMSL